MDSIVKLCVSDNYLRLNLETRSRGARALALNVSNLLKQNDDERFTCYSKLLCMQLSIRSMDSINMQRPDEAAVTRINIDSKVLRFD